MPVDEATTLKMHSKVRWGNTDEVVALLKIPGTADCQVRGALCVTHNRSTGRAGGAVAVARPCRS